MSEHFGVAAGVITPNPWMQYRPVASESAMSVSRSYAPSGGGNKDDLVQSVVVSWTNTAPEAQWLHGMVTRSGVQVGLQARSRGYLADFHGYVTAASKPAADAYELFEVSRSGGGMNTGSGGGLGGTEFGIAEKRENTTSAPFMPHSPGLIRVESGDTVWCRVDVRFRTEFWENTSVPGGSSESGFISGDTRIDLFAIPTIVDPGPRPNPTIVGVESAREVSGLLGEVPTVVDVPAGVAEGDMIIAIVANNWGLLSDIVAEESGWTQIHVRDAGWQDIHMRVFLRIATDDEPETYTFHNGLAAEEITHLIVVRDVSLLLDDGWYVASSLRQRWWERNDGHIAPSIDRSGQLLLCLSYFSHGLSQAPITQEQPTGMTVLSEVTGAASTMAIAVLSSPPRPTGERAFVPSKRPVWSGHSICVTMLLPGTKPSP
ncbi:Uncharacterised protein [Mycolicibacterium vanbaalenii]|uniref:Uncharacterized protein n=2 Tax=Mycolicibacterium vanbaalenii TaxID=110539 RepID=A0A5S9MMU4_MYCVN|nr:Uncharacterised protein [Mycolicibacterium vanbaalenii]